MKEFDVLQGRPKFENSDQYWSGEYARQRKDRMQDAIDDYLQDDKVSAQFAYDEILECVKDVMDYHQREYVKAQELYDLMTGNQSMLQ